jgi:hypothetical protein
MDSRVLPAYRRPGTFALPGLTEIFAPGLASIVIRYSGLVVGHARDLIWPHRADLR